MLLDEVSNQNAVRYLHSQTYDIQIETVKQARLQAVSGWQRFR